MGKQSTGGYSIEVTDSKLTGGCWFVNLVFRRPSRGQNVIQAMNYPYIILEKSDSRKVMIKVKDEMFHYTIFNKAIR